MKVQYINQTPYPKTEQKVYNKYTLKMLSCFNLNLGEIWTNPNVGLKNAIKMYSWK